jgi:hypothetical protein
MSKRDWIDDSLEAGATFDWITPLWGLGSSLSGNRVSIAVHRDDFPTFEYELKKHHITPRYTQIHGDQIIFYVKRNELDRAKRIVGIE